MKLQKIEACAAPAAEEFAFSEKTVQGARVGKKGDSLYVISPRRFKLYAEGRDTLVVVRGEGFIKWARGEAPFRTGDCFAAEACGEYEVNGDSEFAVLRH